MEVLPSYAKVSELQLGIASPDDASRNVMNLKLQAAASFREHWAGQIAFAAMTETSLLALLAWLEQFDGRLTGFGIPLYEGHFTKTPGVTATLAADTAPGDYRIFVDLSPTSGYIDAGTLLTVGDADSDEYQVFEALAPANLASFTDGTSFSDSTDFTDLDGTNVGVEVSPRVRWSFASGATVTVGATNMRLRLREDALTGHTFALSHGVLTIDVIEGVYA